jgi:hypothetical protein
MPEPAERRVKESQTTRNVLDNDEMARMLTELFDFSIHDAGIFLGFIALLRTSAGN